LGRQRSPELSGARCDLSRCAKCTPRTAIDTITSMALEWGHVRLLITIVLLIQRFSCWSYYFAGHYRGGRDPFNAASAAACPVTAFCEAYCDATRPTLRFR
jgi:hypothetical protein